MFLLAKGRMVYSGPATEVLGFVGTRFRVLESQENPMDYILEFLSTLTESQADKVRWSDVRVRKARVQTRVPPNRG